MANADDAEAVKWFFDWWNRAVPALLPWNDARIKRWLAEQEARARDFPEWFLHDPPVTAVARAIMRDCGWVPEDWPYAVQTELERAIESDPRPKACYVDPDYNWGASRQRIQRILAQHGRTLYDEPSPAGE